MITLLVRQDNQPDIEVEVEGDAATVGRGPGCEVKIDHRHLYVSKRHLRVLKGIVIVDMGSANGTFLDGQRISEPVLYTGGELRLGEGKVFLRVRAEQAEGSPTAMAAGLPAGAGNDNSDLELQLRNARDENQRLAGMLADLRKRIDEVEAAHTGARELSAAQQEAHQALERAQSEIQGLRAQLEAAHAVRPSGPLPPAAELFLKLQSENSSLKRRLAELETKPAPGAPAPAGGVPSKLLAEIVELRAQNAALRAKGGAVPARMVSAPGPSPAGSNARVLFARLARDDVERQPPLLDGMVEDFLLIEQFRLVRQVERIVTRMAGDFIQLYNANTVLPNIDGNMRVLIARLSEPVEDPNARRELMQYFAQMSRWLVASLGAHRKAAAGFAQQLKADLSESGLTAQAPIAALKRLSGQGEAELWRRVGVYLRELTPDLVEDRLEKLTREAALELVGQDGAARDLKAD